MDTSPEYIAMCEKAWPDLKPYQPRFSRNLRMLYILDHLPVYWRNNVNTSNAQRAIPLWEQDQLQEMVRGDPPYPKAAYYSSTWRLVVSWAFEPNEHGSIYTIVNRLLSMEQLWLAFVMHEKFGKHWNGQEWQEVKGG